MTGNLAGVSRNKLGQSKLAPMSLDAIDISAQDAALISAALLGWVALIYLLMAAGLRRGELVWSGQQPRLLDPGLRVRSFLFGLGVAGSGLILVWSTGLLESPIPQQWEMSATFVAMSFLGVGFLYAVFAGSTWERMLFAPILLLGTLFAGWLTFG